MGRRFTLVELMIVVAIMMVLAAIAIPLVIRHQLEAKRAEVYTNTDGVVTAITAYNNAYDVDWCCGGWAPAAVGGKKAIAWPTDDAGFNRLGWRPDGDVRCQYSASSFVMDIICDLDGTWPPNTYRSYPEPAPTASWGSKNFTRTTSYWVSAPTIY